MKGLVLDSYILLVLLETREFEPFVEPGRQERPVCVVRILIRHSFSVKYSDYYGPLSMEYMVNDNYWMWVATPMPWEYKGGM